MSSLYPLYVNCLLAFAQLAGGVMLNSQTSHSLKALGILRVFTHPQVLPALSRASSTPLCKALYNTVEPALTRLSTSHSMMGDTGREREREKVVRRPGLKGAQVIFNPSSQGVSLNTPSSSKGDMAPDERAYGEALQQSLANLLSLAVAGINKPKSRAKKHPTMKAQMLVQGMPAAAALISIEIRSLLHGSTGPAAAPETPFEKVLAYPGRLLSALATNIRLRGERGDPVFAQ
ncbi:hypothetical protein KIPB_010132, partial [Kipferlia bialata]|eukprot:g10132.t1